MTGLGILIAVGWFPLIRYFTENLITGTIPLGLSVDAVWSFFHFKACSYAHKTSNQSRGLNLAQGDVERTYSGRPLALGTPSRCSPTPACRWRPSGRPAFPPRWAGWSWPRCSPCLCSRLWLGWWPPPCGPVSPRGLPLCCHPSPDGESTQNTADAEGTLYSMAGWDAIIIFNCSVGG